ncbi:MAG: helix-turn-helix domain-containing protein [Tannerellaceae bacterium]|nr:helix-turn-helix domain-containing protein [Tannerellaceae bacterium]
MKYKRLSHSQFAEEVGIQRSTVSHIMKDRNNPSMRVFRKIIDRFTDINPDWLLSGIGNMIIKENQTTQGNLFANNAHIPEKPPVKPYNTQTAGKPPGIKPYNTQITENRPEIRVEEPKIETKQAIPEKVIIQKTEPKNISKIMIFYSDNTFETFIPEKIIKKD